MRGPALEDLVRGAGALHAVSRTTLRPGDSVLVQTLNSSYRIRVRDHGSFDVSGGWFDRNGPAPIRTTIAGCTWGGSAIKIDVIAACGLCIEFGNRVRTSIVRSIVLFPATLSN